LFKFACNSSKSFSYSSTTSFCSLELDELDEDELDDSLELEEYSICPFFPSLPGSPCLPGSPL
jgi:hypothetical protein